jgi:preprotein translocase subunit SecG
VWYTLSHGKTDSNAVRKGGSVETALFIAILIISAVLATLIVLQSRGGAANRDSGAIARTRRGLEKTLHQATIVLSAVFLLLALITSLPLFG